MLAYALLIWLYPILFFYAHNQAELRLSILLFPLLAAIFAAGLISSLGYLFFKKWSKAALLTALAALLFYSYGHIAATLPEITLSLGSGHTLGTDKLLYGMYLAVGLGSAVFVWRLKHIPKQLHTFLTVTLGILTLYQLASISYYEVQLSQQPTPAVSEELPTPKTTPDIYYIVLDSYGRTDVLKELGYDNSWFISGLEELGFSVADQAQSNYAHTFLSLPSTLNMQYLHQDLDPEHPEEETRRLHSLLHHNQVAQQLQEYNYEVINFASNWGPTDNLEGADINHTGGRRMSIGPVHAQLNEFYLVFLQTTILSPFVKDSIADQARAKVLVAFDLLKEIPYRRGDQFVIAHFNVPHPPYLFDAQGNPIPDAVLELSGETYSDTEHYLQQVHFVSGRTLDTVQQIIERSAEPPIIIVQSDHGPATRLGHPYSWPRPAPEEGMRERMGIIYAVYAPGMDPAPKQTTPVNLYRHIFNNYFNFEYELLPNESYFSDYEELFEFTPVPFATPSAHN